MKYCIIGEPTIADTLLRYSSQRMKINDKIRNEGIIASYGSIGKTYLESSWMIDFCLLSTASLYRIDINMWFANHEWRCLDQLKIYHHEKKLPPFY